MGLYVPFEEGEVAFLNNFFLHFPVGNDPYPSTQPEGFYRTTFREPGGSWKDGTFRALVQDLGLPESSLQTYYSTRSDKLLEGTPEQFYMEMDETARELGVSLSVVARTINVFLHDRNSELKEGLDKLLSPIYTALRNNGYNKADLWS